MSFLKGVMGFLKGVSSINKLLPGNRQQRQEIAGKQSGIAQRLAGKQPSAAV